MADATLVSAGNMIDYTPGGAIASGDVVVLGSLVGVATRPIAANELGALAVTGIFDFVKATTSTSAIAVGAPVYWDDGNDVATGTEGSNKQIGWAVAAASAAATTVRVLLGR